MPITMKHKHHKTIIAKLNNKFDESLKPEPINILTATMSIKATNKQNNITYSPL